MKHCGSSRFARNRTAGASKEDMRGKDYRHFLPVCYFDPGGIATANEYVALWQSASRY
jgi:hypothetical protein